ncbi:MAG: hypothetical protein ACREFI_08815 [Stellaceae bacterium]
MPLDKNIYRSAKWTPEQARAELAKAQTDPEFKAVFMDKNHRLHASLIERKGWLHQVIAGEPAPAGATSSPWPKSGPSAERRMTDIAADPAWRDRMHPRHDDTVRAYSAAVAEQVAEKSQGGDA